MHATQLVEIAIAFVHHTRTQIALKCGPTKEAAHGFWLSNRFRHEEWSSRLAAHRNAILRPGVSYRNACWLEIAPVMQEVLLAEPISRCIAYHAAALEENQIDFDLAPLAQSTLTAHIEARHRCLHLIVFGAGLSVELAVRLNRLRRQMESITDQLIALMHPSENLSPYCFDSTTTKRLQAEFATVAHSDSQCRIQVSAISQDFWNNIAGDTDHRPASSRLNERLSKALLELMPAAQFDGLGLPHSPKHRRLLVESSESDGKPVSTLGLTSPLDLTLPNKRAAQLQHSERRW